MDETPYQRGQAMQRWREAMQSDDTEFSMCGKKADVALKERRELVLVPRETPLSEIHLENLLRLRRLGAVVLPAMPGFYHLPGSIEDLVDHVVGKVLDTLRIEHRVGARWEGFAKPAPGDPGLEVDG